jgi:metal-responsive CopG/Arc/MetJ family transcriptional regulator
VVILDGVKTAISIPDATFERVDRQARELGVSRSEFYTRAAERWLDALDDEHATEQIDRALLAAGEEDSEKAFLDRAAERLAGPGEVW